MLIIVIYSNILYKVLINGCSKILRKHKKTQKNTKIRENRANPENGGSSKYTVIRTVGDVPSLLNLQKVRKFRVFEPFLGLLEGLVDFGRFLMIFDDF